MAAIDDNPFRRRLLSGERLLWIGTPGQGLIFRPQDLLVIPLSLFWFGFAIFWTYHATKAGGAFGLFGLPFLAVGLFMVFGRFILDVWIRRRTGYAITDRRVLIQREGPFGAFVTLDLARLPEMTLVDESGTRGTVRFGPPSARKRGDSIRLGLSGLDDVPQFVALERANDVMMFILEAAGAARGAEAR